ncbi:hypothetical protein [Pseudofrankia saprophytica]|uniref:hypothetical protein n=1 Tax=Pseudofrankia saprophytica TaxID=298655 RepID=UPI000234B921|nr:hypothetical protein [Pseudofrankia saprophytica]
MQGNWNHGHAHYRYRYPQEHARANHIDHPLTVYVREDAILPTLDAWLATAFDPDHVEATPTALERTQPDDSPTTDPLRQAIAACDLNSLATAPPSNAEATSTQPDQD